MTAPAGDEGEVRVRRQWRRWHKVVAVVALLLLAALTILWFERRIIARHFVDDELNRRGVAARYEIAQLSPWRQRLTNVVIGDPARPDLTAEWVELRTSLLPWRLDVLVIRAGAVRMRGRLVGGKLSLGAIDRLMPAPSGKPFTLPHMVVELDDARMALDTPQGAVALSLSGSGMLDDGFAGRLSGTSDRLDLGGCIADQVRGDLKIGITRARPAIDGPIAASSLGCGTTRIAAPQALLAVGGNAALDRWQGNARLNLVQVAQPQFRVASVAGQVGLVSDRGQVRGNAELASGAFWSPQASGEGLRVSARYAVGQAGFELAGLVGAHKAALPASTLARIGAQAHAGAGTPIGPIVAQLVRAATAAGRSFNGDADLVARGTGGRTDIAVSRLRITAATGATLTLAGGSGFRLGLPEGSSRIEGTLTLGGGQMPAMVAQLRQAAPGAPILGKATVQPMVAGGARLALAPVVFSASAGGATRIATTAILSGPLGDGRAEGLFLPIEAMWSGGRLTVNSRCADAGFDRLHTAGLVLERTRLRLCPMGQAMLTANGKALGGGVRVASPRLHGTLGGGPLTLTAGSADYGFATDGFTLTGLAARLGKDPATRLDAAHFAGRFHGNAAAGDFAGLTGQIGNVPLLISEGAGGWKFADARLTLAGGLTVADAGDPARFKPLVSRDAALTLADNRIVATATLDSPAKSVKVAEVRITHDLSGGTGQADIQVPGVAFSETGLQPTDLSAITYGVIADVAGTLSGEGQIRWDRAGVTSSGTFRTTGADMAASFGPARKVVTEVHFTDLLGLQTAPGQVATIAELNPGVPVNNGIIHYRLLSGQRVQIEDARWPFAGGELILEPTILDFAEHHERRMTFRVVGADAAQFLKEMAFDNLDATGVFDGTLPMIFDETGGRIEGGHLQARSGGSIAYIGEVTQHDLGTWGNIAFQALKALDYRNLSIEMNGPLAGEMVTQIRFAGISQGKGAKSNFVIRRLAKLPFVFNVQIRAPFRQLLDSVQGWYDPQRLIERNLPALIEKQNQSLRPQPPPPATAAPSTSIQPPESERVP